MILYWAKIITADRNKLTNVIYCYFYRCFMQGSYKHPWIQCLQNIFDSCGLSHIWINQTFHSINWLKSCIKEVLQNQFVQEWNCIINDSPKCINYRILKTNFELEYYLLNLPKDLRIFLTRLRTCNHRLPIETGRWNNIERNLRKCTKCNCNSIGDEFHYILECTFFSNDRKMYLDNRFCTYPNTFKFHELMNTNNFEILKSLAKFIKKIFNAVCSS